VDYYWRNYRPWFLLFCKKKGKSQRNCRINLSSTNGETKILFYQKAFARVDTNHSNTTHSATNLQQLIAAFIHRTRRPKTVIRENRVMWPSDRTFHERLPEVGVRERFQRFNVLLKQEDRSGTFYCKVFEGKNMNRFGSNDSCSEFCVKTKCTRRVE
jgi:hypothetical protein